MKNYDKKRFLIIIILGVFLILLGIGIYTYNFMNNNNSDNANEIRFGYLGLQMDHFGLKNYTYNDDSEFEGLNYYPYAVFDEEVDPITYYWEDIYVLYKEFDSKIMLYKYLKNIKNENTDSKRKRTMIAGSPTIIYEKKELVDDDDDDDCSDGSDCSPLYFYYYDYYLIKKNSIYYFKFVYSASENKKSISKTLNQQIDNFIKSIKVYNDFYDIQQYQIELEKEYEKEIAEDTVYLVESNNDSNIYRYKTLNYSVTKEFDDAYNSYSDDVCYNDGMTDSMHIRMPIYYGDKNDENFDKDIKSIESLEKIKSTDKYDVYYYYYDYGYSTIYGIAITDSENYYYEIELMSVLYDSDDGAGDYEAKNAKLKDLAGTFKDSISIINVCNNVCNNPNCGCKS